MTNTSYNITAILDIDTDNEHDWIGRGRERGFAYWNYDGTPLSEEQLVDHVAHNAVANGVTDISQLDGWGDFPRGAVTFRVSDVEAS